MVPKEEKKVTSVDREVNELRRNESDIQPQEEVAPANNWVSHIFASTSTRSHGWELESLSQISIQIAAEVHFGKALLLALKEYDSGQSLSSGPDLKQSFPMASSQRQDLTQYTIHIGGSCSFHRKE